jgi:eukaryotic-like serine/threonine-protein kinase
MQRIGRYEVLDRIGSGGMAEVLLGRTTGEGGFEKLVAIKRILPHMAANQEFVGMFIDEARISANLSHSNIAQIFEFGRDADDLFIAMELVLGVDLRTIHRTLHKRRQLPPVPVAAFLIQQVCAALDHAHNKPDAAGQLLGIIHRDVSPSNVLISFEGEVKLIDFGIAKATHRLSVTVGADLKGKYAYMSPEQAAGLPIDHRSDVFAAGTLLFELLTGLNPFLGDNDLATLERVRKGRVPAPSTRARGVPPALDAVCRRALARNPRERYRSAGEMQDELEAFTRHAGCSSRQMARWMHENFAEELTGSQRMLAEARSRPPLQPTSSALLHAELSDPSAFPPTVTEATVPDVPVPLTSPKLAAGSSTTPTSSPLAPAVAVPAPTPRTARVATPLEPTRGTPTGPMARTAPTGPLTRIATGAPPVRRSRLWPHVLAFSLFAAAVLVGIYLLASRRDDSASAATGSIRITARPPSAAQVFVDDELHGALPAGGSYLVERLLPGKHRIGLRGSQFQPVETVVEVATGRITTLDLEVTPK